MPFCLIMDRMIDRLIEKDKLIGGQIGKQVDFTRISLPVNEFKIDKFKKNFQYDRIS